MKKSMLEQFGDIVRECRVQRGLSQEELAHASGLHRTQISLIERGERCPRLDTIFKLAQALEIQPNKLIPKFNFKSKNF